MIRQTIQYVAQFRRVLALLVAISMVLCLCGGNLLAVRANATDSAEQGEPVSTEEASGEEVPGDASETDETAGETLSDADRLYQELMSCETYDTLSERMDALTEEERALMEEFSAEQTEALNARVAELSGYETDVLARPGGGGTPPGGDSGNQPGRPGENEGGEGGGGNTELDESKYDPTTPVYWDTMQMNYNSEGVAEYSAYGSTQDARIEYVRLIPPGTAEEDESNYNVAWDTSTGTGSATTNENYYVGHYYPGAAANSMTTADLVIKPKTGYYVTKVVIACTSGPGEDNPYECNTWNEGNAYEADFDIQTGTFRVTDLSSLNFSHYSTGYEYFILIMLANIPSPLYVEYDYGEIVNYIGTGDASSFETATGWTDYNGKNYYGDPELECGMDTDATQFRYAYDTSMDEAGIAAAVGEWKHYTNTISQEAHAQAATAGYYFTGWEAEYYQACESTENEAGAYNNYTYEMASEYGTGSYGEGEELSLSTHVRLIAQWAPMELTVTKTVAGLTGDHIEEHTYTLAVQQLQTDGSWAEYQTFTVTVDGNGTVSETVSPVPAGTYRVVETEGRDDLTDSAGNVELYITVTEGGQITINADNPEDALEVVNEYDETETYSATVEKTVSGTETGEEFSFTAKVLLDGAEYILPEPEDGSYTVDEDGVIQFSLSHGEALTLKKLPVGGVLWIRESSENYAVAVAADGTPVEADPDGWYKLTVTEGITVTVTNTYKPGVTIEKTVVNPTEDVLPEDLSFHFDAYVMLEGQPVAVTGYTYDANGQFRFTLAHGGSVTLENLPQGSILYFKETADGYTAAVTVGGEALMPDTAGWYAVTVGSADVSVSVMNTYKPKADITVEKTVTNLPEGTDASGLSFRFEGYVLLDGERYPVDGYTYENGVFTFTLAGGGSLTLEELPEGSSFHFRETDAEDYKVSVSAGGAELTPDADGWFTVNVGEDSVTVAVTNTYVVKLDAAVEKDITGNMGDYLGAFDFEACILVDDTLWTPPTPEDGSFSVDTEGHISFTLGDGKSVALTDLPEGAVLYLKETNPGNHTVTVTAGDQAVTADNDGWYVIGITDGIRILVENNYEVTIPTGVLVESAPYLLILGIIAVAGVLLFVRRRDDDV